MRKIINSDAWNFEDQQIIDGAPRISEFYSTEAKAHFELENLKTELLECKNRLSPL